MYHEIQNAKRALAALQTDPTDADKLTELTALIRAILGPQYKDDNPMDGSDASWQEDRGVREARYREADRATFREMLGLLETTEDELRTLGIAGDIFPN